jgi:thioesterase domain-containing protein
MLDDFALNFRAAQTYAPGPYAGRMVYLRARRSWPAGGPDPVAAGDGWRSLALAGVEEHTLVGDHFDLLRAPRVGRVARILAGHLGEPMP